MDIILIPGLWLDGSSWETVVPVLKQAGHRTYPGDVYNVAVESSELTGSPGSQRAHESRQRRTP